MTQKDRILRYISEHGSITQGEAYKLGIARLAARVNELGRAGVVLDRELVDGKNQYGESVRYMRYWVRQ